MKINIDNRYFPEEEIRDPEPYKDYYSVLSSTFDLPKANGLCDLGCATGWLLHFFKNDFPDKKVLGLEYFDWQKEAAPENIKSQIQISDLREPLDFDFKYDIVNCAEVGEHIEPEKTQVFLDNIKSLCNKYLIISWAEAGGDQEFLTWNMATARTAQTTLSNDREHDPNLQHLNPLKFPAVKELFLSQGFKYELNLSSDMLDHSLQKEKFYGWWRKSLSVWSI